MLWGLRRATFSQREKARLPLGGKLSPKVTEEGDPCRL